MSVLRQDLYLVLQATALSTDADTAFASVSAGELPVKANRADQGQVSMQLGQLLGRVSDQELYITMMNQGNLLDIEAELKRQIQGGLRQGVYAAWQRIAQAVISVQDNEVFHVKRSAIFQPFGQQMPNVPALIADAKQAVLSTPGVPDGVQESDVSWDAVSYKVVPSIAEMFSVKFPQLLQVLSIAELAVLDNLEKMCYNTIREKCAEYRQRTETTEDEFISDLTLFLEVQVAGIPDQSRQERIKKMGPDVLRTYVDKMQGLFAAGYLPGAIAPSKVYACHDVVSAIELRGAIQKLAETQVTQYAELLGNKSVLRRAEINAASGGDSQFTPAQQLSIGIKRGIDQGYRLGEGKLGGNLYDKPQKQLQNQLAGGSNTLSDQMDLTSTGGVLKLNYNDDEILKQQLSLLLACIRVRCDAVQNSQWELVPEEDFDHLEIVKVLSQISGITFSDDIYRTAVMIQESYLKGHNVTKFEGKYLPKELADFINYTIEGRARQILKAVPLFEQDKTEGSELFNQLMRCMTQSLAYKQRVQMELNERFIRRVSVFNSATSLMQ